ncbi:hypothetical protein [Acinetobacter lwoffii]|uniref:hypothetical protein n=1 Tax=Acinetobacter lwoffii TaxID=28090 RepID=UPI0002CE78F0|nr:hypothetical protein [Acinetobacter lwoffii]ENW31418.1 hypothetical protein F924_00161 [Acinetobacter lwoffii ATCC 9957 = CIP 70.31]
MNMQAQLLTIIEDQQKKLEDALNIIQKQNRTIEQLESFNKELMENRTALLQYQQKLVQALNNIQSADLSAKLLSPLENALDNHLKHLIGSLDIKQLVSEDIKSLIEMQFKVFKEQLIIQQKNTQYQAEEAVEQAVKPIKQQLMSELEVVQKYQQHLQDLIQQISAKL